MRRPVCVNPPISVREYANGYKAQVYKKQSGDTFPGPYLLTVRAPRARDSDENPLNDSWIEGLTRPQVDDCLVRLSAWSSEVPW